MVLQLVRNELLRGLRGFPGDRLQGRLRLVNLAKGDVLHLPGDPLDQVYFPESAVLALTAETHAGESVDVVLVGKEGVAGAFEACGSRQCYTRTTVQIAGEAWRLSAAHYRELFDSTPALRTAVHKHVELLLVEARQFVACNALHTVENRLARTLLDIADRLGGTRLPLTQDALANLLGVQRTTIAGAVSSLQRAGILRGGRGYLDIADQNALEAVSCSCRETLAYVRAEIQSSDTSACEA